MSPVRTSNLRQTVQGKRYGSVAIFTMEEVVGDGLLKLPFMRTVRSTYPNAHISWLTAGKSVYAGSLRELAARYVDEVRELTGIGSDGLWPLRARPAATRRYDLLVDTQPVFWRTLAVRRLPHDVFISPAANFLFSDIKPEKGWIKPAHLTDRLIELLRLASGGAIQTPEWTNYVDPYLAAKAACALPDGPTYVGFAPGAGASFKRWPIDRFLAVAGDQASKGRTPVFIVGPNELDLVARIRDALPGALFPEQMPLIWGEKFSPLNTMAIGRRLAAALTNDSGVSHMLAAADTPTLTLFGRTNARKFRPLATRAKIMTAADFGGQEIADVPLDAVTATFESLVSEVRSRKSDPAKAVA